MPRAVDVHEGDRLLHTDSSTLVVVTTKLTLVHAAAGRGDVAVLRGLLAGGADPNALEPRCGVSPLHLAAQGGSVATAEILLDCGAFLNLQAPTTGVTPLMMAVWCRKPAMVRYLLVQPGINVELRAVFGVTAFELIGFGARPQDSAAQEENEKLRALFDDHACGHNDALGGQQLFTTLIDTSLSDS